MDFCVRLHLSKRAACRVLFSLQPAQPRRGTWSRLCEELMDVFAASLCNESQSVIHKGMALTLESDLDTLHMDMFYWLLDP